MNLLVCLIYAVIHNSLTASIMLKGIFRIVCCLYFRIILA
uniref:Uncharacterized protein n=1 Tax=Rhizophora mucronata TaxID=61149 RepID=A0A2P2NGH5_RHIMU